MAEEEPDPGLKHEETADERSLFADIGTLIEDGRMLVEAEIAYQKTRAGYAGRQGFYLVVMLAFIAVLVALALMAMVLGIVLALAPIFTAWGAGVAVAGVLILIALCVLALALRFWRNLRKAFGDGE